MEILSVTYSKVFNLGNFENEKIGVEIVMGEGDNLNDIMERARKYVHHQHELQNSLATISNLEQIINFPDDYTGNQVTRAKATIAEMRLKVEEGQKLLCS